MNDERDTGKESDWKSEREREKGGVMERTREKSTREDETDGV